MSLIENSEYYQERVFKGLFSKKNSATERTHRVREFTSKLCDEHFTGSNLPVYTVISRYFYQTYTLCSPADFIDYIKSADDATEAKLFEYKQLLLIYMYGELPNDPKNLPDGSLSYITDAEFLYAINRLREQTQTDLYGEALSDTMEILVRGKTIEKKYYKGFEDARLNYARQLHVVEHVGGTELPQGTVNEEGEEIKQEYAKAKHGESSIFRVNTGIVEVDNLTGGGAPGEMWFITGFCQPKGSLVLTEDGFHRIENVTRGMTIPQQGKVLNTFYFPPKPLVEIQAQGCLPVKFSWDHPIAVLRGGEELLVHAVDVQNNDLVKLPRLREEELPPPVTTHAIPVNKNLLTVLAAYLSDGSLNYSTYQQGCKEWDTFEIHVRARTLHRLPLLRRALTAIGLPFTEEVVPLYVTERTTLRIVDREFGRWVFDEFGRDSLGTRIPGWMLRLPFSYTKHFLSSYTDGNAKISLARKTWCSANAQMLSSIILMTAKLGLEGNRVQRRKGSSAPIYTFSTTTWHTGPNLAQDEYLLSPVYKTTSIPAEPVYGIETESGWYYAPFLVHNTAEGKTTECINIAYNAMLNGQNVVFGTAETLREQVRRRLITRHSINPLFHTPRGLTGDALKRGILNVEEEILFNNVVDDLCTNESYGKFKIVQIPRRCTVDYYTGLLAKYETEFYVHVAVWDELRLAGVGSGRPSRREELNDIITDAKQLAVSHRHHDDTTGFLLLAPYQVSRVHWQNARTTGQYDKSCLSETSEAEKTADLIWSHLQLPDTRDLTCQILKYRDGSDRIPDFRLEWRPEVCFIGSLTSEHDDLLEG